MLDDNLARQLDRSDFNVEILLSSKESVFHWYYDCIGCYNKSASTELRQNQEGAVAISA